MKGYKVAVSRTWEHSKISFLTQHDCDIMLFYTAKLTITNEIYNSSYCYA